MADANLIQILSFVKQKAIQGFQWEHVSRIRVRDCLQISLLILTEGFLMISGEIQETINSLKFA